jgi:hypothetical protein
MISGTVAAVIAGITLSGGDIFCSVTDRMTGANIEHGAGLVAAVTIIGALLAIIGRNAPPFLLAVLVLSAAGLLAGVVFVGLDSGVVRQTTNCSFLSVSSSRSTESTQLWGVGVVWVAAAIVLLWQAARLITSPVWVERRGAVAVSTQRQRVLVGAIVLVVCAWFVVKVVHGGGSVDRAGAHHASLPSGTKRFAESNHNHVLGIVRYDHAPPAGGAHADVWLNCGVYNHPVRNENAVHSLEHGAVWVTYRPSLGPRAVARLRHIVQSHYRGPDRYLVLSPYPGLPSRLVASAWGAQLPLERVGDPRLTAFISHFAGGGQGGEPGGYCTDGTGSPLG